jgi:hypothetical protein
MTLPPKHLAALVKALGLNIGTVRVTDAVTGKETVFTHIDLKKDSKPQDADSKGDRS